MNLFTAQKHASFAAKLFTAAGFDFEKALAANDAEALKTHIAAQSPAAVSALFANAGLNLETLLAAGPESLKAHLETCTVKAEEFTALETQLSEKQKDLEAKVSELSALSSQLSASHGILTQIGVNVTHKSTSEEITAAFQTHVSKQVTLALAKTGHPPVVHIDAAAGAATLAASDSEIAKAYSALPRGPEKTAFYQKNAAALQRVYDAQNRRDE